MFGFFFGDVRVSFCLCGFYLPPQLVVQKGLKISTTSHLSGLSVDLYFYFWRAVLIENDLFLDQETISVFQHFSIAFLEVV